MSDEAFTFKFIGLGFRAVLIAPEYQFPRLPDDGRPSEWFSATGELNIGYNGIHCLRRESVFDFFASCRSPARHELFEIEGAGDFQENSSCLVWRKARIIRRVWDLRESRLLAADLAEMALPAWEAYDLFDCRMLAAIDAAREYASGRLTASDAAAVAQLAFRASVNGPRRRRTSGELERKAAAAALAAGRAVQPVPEGESGLAILHSVIPAALDAGVPWEELKAKFTAALD